MIVTVTPNPSLDRSALVAGRLTRGEVHRLSHVRAEAGGKGVNVARALHLAGRDVLAILPAGREDPFLAALAATGVPFRQVDIDAPVRSNLTLTESDGTTTKLNEPGPDLTPAQVDALTSAVVEASQGADWVALAGSLPPGAPVDWYPRLVDALAATGTRVAVDTSDGPLLALADALPGTAPDLVKPNALELAQFARLPGDAFARQAEGGDVDAIVGAASTLVAKGIGTVLVTLGSAGAVLVTPDGAWRAVGPAISVRSTVGAGDAALAGFLRAHTTCADEAACLRLAVAYGSAAASLPGSTMPAPEQVDPAAVRVARLR